MTSSRAIEYRITQQLMSRERGSHRSGEHFARKLITATAVAGGMLLLGSFFQELLFAVIAAAAVFGIGVD